MKLSGEELLPILGIEACVDGKCAASASLVHYELLDWQKRCAVSLHGHHICYLLS